MSVAWRAAPGLPNYEVSSSGQARRKGAPQVRKLKRCKRGYLWLSVANGKGSSKNISIARLVCGAFNASAPDGMDVDHVNRIRDDNSFTNLRWVTRSENLSNRCLARGEQSGVSKITDKIAKSILARSSNGEKDTAIAQSVGLSRRQVADIRLRKAWSHINA